MNFEQKVVIVTGAGNGLGREHALAFAKRGAHVVVNDLGGDVSGEGGSLSAAQQVVQEIEQAGGQAMANGANVANAEQVQAMVDAAVERWGRVDVLVNNAGILRDKSFAKGSVDDFKTVVDVHLMGAVNCCKAVWPVMQAQNYGRIVMTSSSSGLYGNFGQANYGAAKTAVIGLMNVLHIEGAKHDIRVNAVAPSAGTRMLEGLIPPDLMTLLDPAAVSPAVVFLASEDAPSRIIMDAGAGLFAVTRIEETAGLYLAPEERSAETIAARFDEIADRSTQRELKQGFDQTFKMVEAAAKAQGIELPKLS